MAVNRKFEAYKVQREIKRSGSEYVFKRNGVNEYGEPSEDEEEVAKVSGLYHEESEKVVVNNGDAVRIRTQKNPSVLCLYDEAKKIQSGDWCMIGKKKCVVTAMIDFQEWGLIADIVMGVTEDGNKI